MLFLLVNVNSNIFAIDRYTNKLILVCVSYTDMRFSQCKTAIVVLQIGLAYFDDVKKMNTSS